jgi:hypothetical protein
MRSLPGIVRVFGRLCVIRMVVLAGRRLRHGFYVRDNVRTGQRAAVLVTIRCANSRITSNLKKRAEETMNPT